MSDQELRKGETYRIRVTNLVDNSVWQHRSVPFEDVKCLILNKNLKVEVIKLVSYKEEYIKGVINY